jgi:hypothetical protein
MRVLSKLTPRLRTAGAIVSMIGVIAGVAATAPAPALAICKYPPCTRDPGDDPTPTPTPKPTVTTIRSISPGYAWSGDTLTIAGTGFTGATVTINGLSATITSPGSTSMAVTVPQIVGAPAGPYSVPSPCRARRARRSRASS